MNESIPRFTTARTMHLIDIENLCGTSMPSAAQVEEVRALYESVMPVGENDQVVIASSHVNLLAAAFGWPCARALPPLSGPDGADIRLAEVIVYEHLAERFDTVCMASGDGGLAPFVAHLGGQGVHTIAVSRRQSISPRMRLAANETIYLPNPLVRIPQAIA